MDDWKLKSRAVVKLRKKRNMFVSSILFVLVWRLNKRNRRAIVCTVAEKNTFPEVYISA